MSTLERIKEQIITIAEHARSYLKKAWVMGWKKLCQCFTGLPPQGKNAVMIVVGLLIVGLLGLIAAQMFRKDVPNNKTSQGNVAAVDKNIPQEDQSQKVLAVAPLTYDRLSQLQIELLRKKADDGDVKAQSEFGQRLLYGIGIVRDESLAAEYLEKAAEKDDIVAKAICYDEGFGTARDMKQAVEWYRKAAEAGDSVAQNTLGVCYENGYGVDKDESIAMRWYKKAADQGLAVAYSNMGSICEEEPEKAFELVKKAADMGCAAGQAALGALYLIGQGVEADPEEAINWARKAEKNKQPDADLIFAISYANGIGVRHDVQEADKRAQRWIKFLHKNIRNDADAIHCVDVTTQLLTMTAGGLLEGLQRLSSVDLSRCPQEFKTAYIDVVQRVRELEKLNREFAQFKIDAENANIQFQHEVDNFYNQDNATVSIGSFSRGNFGSSLGKANDIQAQENQLHAMGQNLDEALRAEAQKLIDREKTIQDRILEALDKLEKIAVMNDTHFSGFNVLRENISNEQGTE